MTSFNEWINKTKNSNIKYIEYSEFSNVGKVGEGGYGTVKSANWKSCEIKVALKTLNNNSSVDENYMNEFVKELKNLKEASFHPNIIGFYGISEEPSNKYAMVLEFANQGNLREYLTIYFKTLQWSDKIRMASDIVRGLKCLHSSHIIHRDLHAKNILVSNHKLMIADFGASKQLLETTSNSSCSTADGIGMIEYMEPQRFKIIDYKKNKKSDIYSLGILLWEISSGRPPYLGYPRYALGAYISYNNIREKPIKDTPLEYQQLYQKCWNDDPNLRPDIEDVCDILIKLETDEFPGLPLIVLQPQPDSSSFIEGKKSNSTLISSCRYDSNQDDLVIATEIVGKEEFRNLLIVGYASSGKSTLSNVLCAANDFEECESSARNTRNFQKTVFKRNGTTYRLIDIGFNSIKNILSNKTEIIRWMPEGISQVLFVVDGRFNEKEVEMFELFEKLIFDSKIVEYTTIVRTKFYNFKNKYKCEEDINQMCEESKTIAKIIKSCSVIHVDNPSTNIIVNDDDDQERINYNKKIREKSRKILLNHLEIVCQKKCYKYNDVFTYSQLIIDQLEERKKKLLIYTPDKTKEQKIINLLIVGYACSGKSTLSNALCDTDHFEGNKNSIKKTKSFQKQSFKWKETEYCVVDTVKIGDIKNNIHEKIAELICLIPEGISRVLFVIDKKFSAEEASTFNLFKDHIFESGIAEYITIVRTKFNNFKNEDECNKDKEDLCGWNESIAKLCKSAVYVDIPPINISVRDEDDKEMIRINEKRRNHSREILLDHLNKVLREKYYNLKVWDNASIVGSEVPARNLKPGPSKRSLKSDDMNSSQETIGKLIIVGRTNSGKSTLANVLSDPKQETKYYVVDTKVTDLTKNILRLSDEMSQFLFVIDGKFTTEEIKAIFNSGIYENVTIIRTKFSNFKNEDECNRDKEELQKEIRSFYKESGIVAKICRSIVYVDNPPINISVIDEDDKKTNEINKKKRNQSRFILLNHLDKVFLEKYYELKAQLYSNASKGNIVKVEHSLKLEIPTLDNNCFEKAERDFGEKILSNMIKNLGHNNKVCIIKFLKEWIDERINEKDIDYLSYNEFGNVEKFDKGIHKSLKKANWENQKITVVLKNLNNSRVNESDFKELITKLKTFRKVNHPNINRFFGLTRDSDGNYFSVMEYVNGGNLRDYLKSKFDTLRWNDKLQMALDITRGLTSLHLKKIIHGNLHSRNVLVNNGTMIITDLRLLNQVEKVTSEYTVYVEPQYHRNPSYERDMKSDIYNLGVLLWELTSGHPPFFNYTQRAFGLAHLENKLLNGGREEPAANTPLEYIRLYQKCWQDDPNLRPKINEVYEILSQLKLQSDTDEQLKSRVTLTSHRSFSPHTAKITLEIFKISHQEIIRQLKLNHGLVLNGYDIMTSIQGVVVEDGELEVNLYKGQPLVYTSINHSEDNNLKIDTCINFPVAEINYNANLLESFTEYANDEKKLRESYGDCFARRILVGGQLFIIDFNSATQTQIKALKFYLYLAYNSAKYPTEFQFNSLFTLNILPKLVTLDGEKLNTHEELINWMNNLYQKKMGNIISYDNLIPISQLGRNASLVNGDEAFKEQQPGVANFKEKLSLEKWVGDAVNDNLISWTKDFNLFHGLIINKNDETEISKKIPVNLIEIPIVVSNNRSYSKIIKSSTKLEFTLITNNIFSIENLSTFPFINNNDKNYESYNHFLIKCEKYEILLNTNNIKPTEEFERAIEEALDSMKPLKALQDVFNEYGHLFPQRIILGRSLKNFIPNHSLSNTFDDVDDYKIFDSLNNLNISSLLTQKGRIIEKNNLHNWIRKTNDHLEIIEFDNIIPLYKILKTEQQEKIEDILKNNYRIIMTGITDLTDLDNNNIENYKRINFGLSLESEDYEVFGLIISKNDTKLEEIYVNFRLYDYKGFFAIIKKSEETSIDITKCSVLWMVVGNPSKLSVFSPKNREIQVNYIKETVALQPDSNYYKKIPFHGYKGYLFSVHAYCPHEPNINVQIIKPICNGSSPNSPTSPNTSISSTSQRSHRDSLTDAIEVELRICIISTDCKNLKIDHTKEKKERRYPLDVSITTDVVSPVII
ncbi:hypothetical protein RclHR1_09510004 [Rhizophagus clarus]|uniref:Kinase-like domain-containing protein n=1 Tax=Rhizophagus clarus TaxID=94130 RepID=A0A2Z6SAQ3_9GLOM|nr:hypothetical protein RclHR1_09510004 [Rhizophagus clarus]GES80274.1 kinase-like domain-containing protein [Rhizophagus clarus]